MPDEVRMYALHERNGEFRREEPEFSQNAENHSHADGDESLPEKLGARGEAKIAAHHDLDVVVGEAHGAESQRRDHRNPDEGISEIGPEQRGQHDGDHDKHAAHGGRAGFLLVRLRAFFADVLADLKLAQLLNDVGADKQAYQQRRQRGEGGPEREIAKDAEWVKERKELFVEQPVEQEDSITRKDSGRFYRR